MPTLFAELRRQLARKHLCAADAARLNTED
jgi:hypothetical protein